MENDNYGEKRAGILTFHSAYNFGAVLQAYALQEYISHNFGLARIIDYHNIDIDKSYSKPHFPDLLHRPKQTLFRLVQSILYKGKNTRIDKFRDDYLKLTSRYDDTNIHKANDDADVFIVGSDQVWNHMIIKRDTNFFLKFVDSGKRTCSYAASIGVNEIPAEYRSIYKTAIKHIQMISVREAAGIQTLSKIGVDNVTLMPDPTLLLSADQWEELSISPNIRRKYILLYKITTADKLVSFAKGLSRKTKLPIIYIPNDLKAGIVGSLKLDVGPREWLGYIKNAEYVVTNSFHGTVFSILLGSKFFCEVSSKVNPSTSRLLNLLTTFRLEDRIIDRFTDEMLGKELPKGRINDVCSEQSNCAYTFLKEVFEGEDGSCLR